MNRILKIALVTIGLASAAPLSAQNVQQAPFAGAPREWVGARQYRWGYRPVRRFERRQFARRQFTRQGRYRNDGRYESFRREQRMRAQYRAWRRWNMI